MLPDEHTSEITRIKSRLTELIDEHFARGESIIYLSKLGTELEADRLILEKLTKKKLAQFLKDDLKDYEVGVTGQHKNILYLARKGQSPAVVPPHAPRYATRFWAAFTKPLATGETQRFIDTKTFYFGPDKEALKQTGASDIRGIDARFISPESGVGGAADIANRITEWLSTEGLEKESFLSENIRTTTEVRTLMAIIISALDAEQLSRVSLPLDVVNTLIKRRI